MVFIPDAVTVLQPQPPASSLAATRDGDNVSTWMSWAKRESREVARCVDIAVGRGRGRGQHSTDACQWSRDLVQRPRPKFEVILYVTVRIEISLSTSFLKLIAIP